MEIKVLELKQDRMTVAEYEAKFTELSRFVPEFVNTEEKKYGKVGHMRNDFPTLRPPASGMSRAASNRPPAISNFNMTVQDAIWNTDLIAGTLLLNSKRANVSFDSGATKSFISRKFAKKLNLNVIPLHEVLQVEIANQEIIPVNQVHPRCKLNLEGKVFEVDLIPFALVEFDVILGMDRVSSNGAQIDCERKKVWIRV
ncbi:uncharacterized protein LOC141659878 [Apium graveolens]|uniref:uncharacterized protein LOC141659878 n=1 Tax=Apium graveolens TaxID=4045 RepID=UPI003D796F2A